MKYHALKSNRRSRVTAIVMFVVFAHFSLAVTANTQKPESADGPELKPQEKIERELSGGEAHSYRITLTAGQYMRVVVEQRGIDVVIRLFGPDSKQITEVNETPASVLESTFLIAETSGAYRIVVEPSSKDAKAGTYEIRIGELREATSKDRVQVAALKVYKEANQLRNQQTAESQRKAIQKYEEALPLWREAGDRFGEANTLDQIGWIYSELGENQKALEYYGQALTLYRAVENRHYEAGTLNSIGDVHYQMGEMQKALESHNQALSLSRAVGDRQEEANALSNVGRVYFKLGEPHRALEYFAQVFSLTRELGYTWREAIALVNMGAVYDSLGEFQKAVEYYGQALPLLRLVGDRREEGVVLNNIGVAYAKLGELPKALENYDQSLTLARVTGNRYAESSTLDNIGNVYDVLSEPQKALQLFEQSLEIKRAVANRIGQAATLHNIGGIYMSLGELQRALEYFDQSLSLRRELKDRRGEAAVLDTIGRVYNSLGEFRKALEYHNQSLSLRRTVGDRYGEAAALANIGTVYAESGELPKALQYFDQALKLRQTVGARLGEAATLHYIGSTYNKLREADKALEYYRQALALGRTLGYQTLEPAVLLGIARVERERGNTVEARGQVEDALNIIESTRAKVASQELRSSFLASKQDYYKFYIDLLMQMHRGQPSAGYDAAALQASERARARSLLDLLTESRADIRQGVNLSLLERERALQQQLNAKSERLTRLLSGKHTEEQETAARKEVAALLTDFQNVEAQIRIQSPRYAALTQPQPLSSKDIQQLLDQDTVLLEYALGEERSHAWAVTPRSVKSFELPKRAVIEAEARRVYGLLVSKSDALDPAALTGLSRMLLGPVADQLGRKRLLVVTDGALQYVPFGALPAPGRGRRPSAKGKRGTADMYRPLILDHEVVNLPSASVVAVLRREVATRPPAPRKVAVLADPVFVKEDGRVKNRVEGRQAAGGGGADKETATGSPPSDVRRSAEDLGLTRFDRLTVSRREAELITALAPSGQSLKALDFAASRATATSPELSRYQIVHFATHSLLNNRHPELSGIVLSLVDERGEPQDGFLRLHEIYNLKLDADLVVLSACETALGKEIKGEGLVGLTRGFMYAGAPRVVASLWKVGDSATAELMRRFYRNMLDGGMRPAAALRAAQVSMWKERQWAAPFYWAGFVIQGEWR